MLHWVNPFAALLVFSGDSSPQDDGGPGRAAALYSHFWMLRRVQRGYACFDAYARRLGLRGLPGIVCTVFAVEMLMSIVVWEK